MTIVGLIIAYLLSFHLVVGPVLGTKVLVLPGEHVPDDAGYVLKDGQFLSYNREWLYASSTPSLNISAYYVYYPVHKVLEATGRAVFVKHIDNLLQETPEHRWPGRWRHAPKESRAQAEFWTQYRFSFVRRLERPMNRRLVFDAPGKARKGKRNWYCVPR